MTKVKAVLEPEAVSTVIQRGHAVGRLDDELASEELSELAFQIVCAKVVEDATALTPMVKCHHEAGLFRRAPKAGHAEAEGAMPPPSGAAPGPSHSPDCFAPARLATLIRTGGKGLLMAG